MPGIHSKSKKVVLEARSRVKTVLDSLGLTRNPAKGDWEPTQRLDHLGLTVSTELSEGGGRYLVPPAKQKRVTRFAKDLLGELKRERRLLPARKLASFAGLCQSLYLALPCARMFLRSLHDCLAAKKDWESRVRVSRQAIRDLEWWSILPPEALGRSIYTEPTTRVVESDACGHSWGGTFENQWCHGRFQGQDRAMHITAKELLAAHLVIESFLPELQGQHVRFMEDNQAVVYVVRSRTSRSPVLMKLLRRLYAMLDLHSITLSIEYVNTLENGADAPSRLIDKSDWQLEAEVWATIDKLYGPHSHDRFATPTTALLPSFTTLYRCPGQHHSDAFSVDWGQDNNFVNPGWQAYRRPFALLERVSQFLRHRPQVAATVVAPYRPNAGFFQALRADSQSMHILEVDPETAFSPAHSRVWLPRDRHLCLFRFDAGRTASTSPGQFVASSLTWQQLQCTADAPLAPTSN